MRHTAHLLAALVFCAALSPAHAWKGESSTAVRPIAEVNENAEEGDFITIEGTIQEVRSGPGSLRIAVVEDETGELLVAVAEYLRRDLEREPGEDPVGARVRVTGKWEHGYLNQAIWAIRATAVERLPST
jgi:hypothetical protein